MDIPEVEALRRIVAERLDGVRITAVEVTVPRVLPGVPRAETVDALLGKTLERADRHGRVLRLQAADGALLLPCRGTAYAALGTETSAAPGGLRLALTFEGGTRLWYGDRGGAATAGLLRLVDGAWRAARDEAGTIDWKTGLEPFTAAFTLPSFKRILERKKRTVLQLLVDDDLIAGIGSPYADEILHVARVRPTRVIPSLKHDEVRLLYYSILEVLQKAVRFGGMPPDGTYLVEGQPSTYQKYLSVHGRADQLCLVCKAKIRRASIGKVRSAYCPRCQK